MKTKTIFCLVGCLLAFLLVPILLCSCDSKKDEIKRLEAEISSATNSLNALRLEKEKLAEENNKFQMQFNALTNSYAQIEGELQAKDRQLDHLRKQIAANDELRTEAEDDHKRESRSKAWESLNKAYFVANDLQKILGNSENHKPQGKWRGIYDSKKNEADELLSTVSLPEAESMKSTIIDLFRDLEDLGGKAERYYHLNKQFWGAAREEIRKGMERGRLTKIYESGLRESLTEFNKTQEMTRAKTEEAGKQLESLKREWDF